MPLLRFAYLLALTLWLGSMITLGLVIAPVLFSTLSTIDPESGRALAGQAFAAILSEFHYVAYAAGAVMLVSLAAMALLGPRPRGFAVRLGIVAIMLGVAAYSGFVVLGEMDGIQQQLTVSAGHKGPALRPGASNAASDHHAAVLVLPSSLPALDPRRVRFDRLHVFSTRLMMVNIAAALVLLAWEAREPSR
jgi:hypothetical protein